MNDHDTNAADLSQEEPVEADLFAEELDDRNNAMRAGVSCASSVSTVSCGVPGCVCTGGCVCTI